MKKQKKYPDQVVYSEERGFYAKLLPYGSNVGAPSIKLNDISSWKQKGIGKVNHQISTKFEELKEEYKKLVEDYKWNEIIYNCNFQFEPIVGNIYFLYKKEQDKYFLSMIEPDQWNQKYIGTFILNSELKWEKYEQEI